MDSQWFDSAAWGQALTLAERNLLSAGDFPAASAEARARARRRLARWQDQPPFGLEEYWTRRLAVAGVSPHQLLDLLAAPVEELTARLPAPPAWVTALDAAYTMPPAPTVPPDPDDGTEDKTDDVAEPVDEMFGFLQLVNPLIDRACGPLQAGIATLAARGGALPFDPQTIEDIFLANLPDPLLMRISRTLVLELHVARLQGELAGETPQARFDSFIARLRQPEIAQAIWREYPVLARQLMTLLNQWAEVSLEFLTRLCDDWDAIRSRFTPDAEPGVLVALAGGAGDTHRGGRSVMVATFESGFRLVYKPKSLQIDAHFQELLTWLNARGCEPPLQPLAVMDRGHYGWVQHVAYATCESRAELQRFYRRHGAYLALLYALNANDFHFENLIAVGEHPILIDLETLLQPRFDTYNESLADSAAVKLMAESTLQVGLLPLRLWSGADYAGIDISGLGGNAGQLSPDRIPRITDAGTDEMRYVRERIEIAGDANRPSLNGVAVSATEYVDDIIAGFTSVYRLIVAHRAELAGEEGLLARFTQDDIRVLIRPTRTYDQLLFESFHPDLLRNALDREQFLDRLWAAAPFRPYLAQVIPAELADLSRGDIPIFESKPSSLQLVNGSGMIVEGVLNETGMDAVRRRLDQLGEADMRRQLWFIRASLATIATASEAPATPGYRLVPGASRVTRARLLDAAAAIADRLAETAVYGEDDACWIGLDLIDEQTWEIRTLGIDLESGLCGVALFLAYAGALTQDEGTTQLARRAYALVARQIDLLREEMRTVGALDGWGGVLYTVTHLAALWEDQAILAQAEGLVVLIGNLAVQDESLDLARGAAGALVTLLAYHRHTRSDAALRAAMACGNHLLAAAKSTEQGLTWTIPGAGDKPASGSSHGAAGIAWALLELAAATGTERYRTAAQQALAHQRTLFAPAPDEWPDRHQTDFCGAAGIGPARVAAWRYLAEPRLARELDAVIQTTLAHGFGKHHALVGGDLGSLELLFLCADSLRDGWTREQADALAAMILDSLERDGPRCGGPLAVEIPGLMLGLAGIGYQMLRLAEPARVPSLLLFAPPIAAVAAMPAAA